MLPVFIFSIDSSEEMPLGKNPNSCWILSVNKENVLTLWTCFFHHLRIFLFFTRLGKRRGGRGVWLLRNIICRPYWRAILLTTARMGIYTQATCRLSYTHVSVVCNVYMFISILYLYLLLYIYVFSVPLYMVIENKDDWLIEHIR